MFEVLHDFFDECGENVLEGYCEFSAEYDYVDNSFKNFTKKIFIFYVNTSIGRKEIVFSKDFNILDVKDVIKFEEPNFIEEYIEGIEILDAKFFAINDTDYLERKKLFRIRDEHRCVFDLYDFLIVVNEEKIVNNFDVFKKMNREILPVDEEKFISSVIFSKRTITKKGSIEEKIYHFEDVSNKERELFYKNKKESGGFTAAQRSR